METEDLSVTPDAPKAEEFSYRKLIRPPLVRNDQQSRSDNARAELRSPAARDGQPRDPHPQIESNPGNIVTRHNSSNLHLSRDGRARTEPPARGERFNPENAGRQAIHKRASRGERGQAKKNPPPEQTHAESFYYQKQMQAKRVMVIVMQDGEELEGVIEWYDKNCIKVNRVGDPNLVIYKQNIRYIFKAEEEESA